MCANPHTLAPTGCIDEIPFQRDVLQERRHRMYQPTFMPGGIFDASSHDCTVPGHANDARLRRPLRGAAARTGANPSGPLDRIEAEHGPSSKDQ
jgi:hypothetical protein